MSRRLYNRKPRGGVFFTDSSQFTIRLHFKRMFISLCFLIEILFWVRGHREEGLTAFGVTEGGTLIPGPACGCVGREELVQDPPRVWLYSGVSHGHVVASI